MKKLAVKIVCAFLFVLSAALLAACGETVSLKDGAVVNLSVQTEAETFEVVSTYGTVEGSGKAYTITVDVKKDFTISVSAKGLKTQTVPVTVADLVSGRCEKSVDLKDELTKEVGITVSGDVENISVTCDGVELALKRGEYTGMLTPTQIKKGITVSADNAVSRTVTFTDEQMESSYLKADTFLVKTGNKAIELRGHMDGKILVDAEHHLISLKPVYEQNQYGGRDFVGGTVVLNGDYEGSLYFKEAYGTPENDVVIEIEKDIPVYGTVIELTEESYVSSQFVKLKNFDLVSDFTDNSYYLYLETEADGITQLSECYVSYRFDGAEQYYGIDIPENTVAIWDITESSVKRALYQGGESFDCSSLQPEEFDPYFCLYDELRHIVRTDIDTVYYYDETNPSDDWESAHKPVPLTEGFAPYNLAYEHRYSVKVEEGVDTWNYKDCSLIDNNYRLIHGKWCVYLRYNDKIIYKINLRDKEGNPVTGALFAENYGNLTQSDYKSPLQEITAGVYEYSTDWMVHWNNIGQYYVKYGDKIESVVIDFDVTNGLWTGSGNTFEYVLTLADPQTAGFYLQVYYHSEGSLNGYVTYSYTVLTEGVELSKVDYLNYGNDGRYVFAPYNVPIQIKVTVNIRYNSSDNPVSFDRIITIEPQDYLGNNYCTKTIYQNEEA